MSLRKDYENLPTLEIISRGREIDFRSTCSLPALVRDPIFTPLFTAVLGTGGFTIGATTITYASIASAIATTALTIGIQAAMAPKPPKPEKGRYPLQQAIPFRIWGVGRNRTAGVFMLYENSPNEVSVYMVQALRGHRIKSINRRWLHDDQVTVDANGFVNALGSRYASSSVKTDYRLGLPTETAYAEAVSTFSSVGLWTNDHRGDGQASLYIRASATKNEKQMKRFPYGIPMLSVESDDAACWDPRDPTQSPTNPSTWKWTQNTALHIIWWLCFSEFGFRLDYRKAILPVLDMWIEDIDICDEDIPNAGGGTHKRYQSNLWDTTENDPKAALNAFLAACDGHLVNRGDGARILTVGKFRESRCATLTDRDIIGHRIDYDVLPEDEVNRLIPKFTYPETDYTTTDTDYFEDIPAQLKAGRVLASDMDLVAVQDWRQARFVASREWKRLRQKARGQLDVRLSGINSVYARWIRLETPIRLPRLDGKLVENRRSILAVTKGGFTVDIVQHPDNIDAWNPATDEGTQPPVPPKPNVNDILTPVINLVQAKPKGESVYIRVVILDPEDESLTPVVRYRLADRGDGQPGGWVQREVKDVTPSGGFIDIDTNVVPSDELLDIQVAFMESGGSYGDWSVTANVTSTVSQYDSSANAIFAAMAVQPNATRKRLINNLVVDLKSAGVWALLSKITVLAAHSEQAALLNWKSPSGTSFSKVGTISFAADQGFTGDGSTGYLDSGTAWTSIATQDNASMWAWSLTNVDANAGTLGTTTSGGNAYIVPRSSNAFFVRAHGANTSIEAVTSSVGFFGWSRASASAFSAYRNKNRTDVTQASAAPPTGNLAVSRAGGGYATQQIAFAAAGASLTSTQETALYDAVREYLRGVGAV